MYAWCVLGRYPVKPVGEPITHQVVTDQVSSLEAKRAILMIGIRVLRSGGVILLVMWRRVACIQKVVMIMFASKPMRGKQKIEKTAKKCGLKCGFPCVFACFAKQNRQTASPVRRLRTLNGDILDFFRAERDFFWFHSTQ